MSTTKIEDENNGQDVEIEEEVEEEEEDNRDNTIDFATLEPEISNSKSRIKHPSEYKIKKYSETCEFGDLMCFYPDSKGEYKIVIGSFWIPYVVISILYLFVNIYFYYTFCQFLSSIVFKIGLGLYIASVISGIRVFLSNPGVPNLKTNHLLTQQDDNDRSFCERCKVWTDNRTMIIHCKTCDCCIDDYDQHSAFFSKCIGKGNYISYNIFIVTNLLSFAFIILIKGLTH